jgi:hypothetical protein
MVSNVMPAVLQTSQSNDLAICVPTEFDINLYPPLFENGSLQDASAALDPREPVRAKMFDAKGSLL